MLVSSLRAYTDTRHTLRVEVNDRRSSVIWQATASDSAARNDGRRHSRAHAFRINICWVSVVCNALEITGNTADFPASSSQRVVTPLREEHEPNQPTGST
jgi:hypothetical protein